MRRKLTAIAVLAATAATLAAVAPAGSTPAKLASLPGGWRGVVMAFAFDTRAPGTVYGATLGGRVYKTTDAGGRWQSTTTGSISTRVDALVADPRHRATLYAGTGVAVYKTMNGGRSWRAWNRGLLPPPPVIDGVIGKPGWRRGEGWVTALAVDPTDSNIVYAGSGGGVKKSADGGHSWKTVLWRGRFMGIGALVIAPTSPQVIYAAASVTPSCGAPGTTRCHQIDLLYKSEDAGKTWRPTSLWQANPEGNFSALAVDQQHPTTLYAAIGSTVLRSTDAGRSWQSITDGLSGNNVNVLAVDPRRSGTVYAGSWGEVSKEGTSGGVFKTTDGGLTWSRVSAGLAITTLAIDPAHPATIYAGVDQSDARIIRSTDGGRTWTTAG